MDADEPSQKVYSQDSYPPKEDPGSPRNDRGPLRWILSGAALGLVVAFLILCGLSSLACDFQINPQFHLACPQTYPGTTIPPYATTPAYPVTTVPPYATTPAYPVTTVAPYVTTPAYPVTTVPPYVTTPAYPVTTTSPYGKVSCTDLTPSPEASSAAVKLALSLSYQFLQDDRFRVQINAFGAIPLNPACLDSESDQLLGMIAPAVDENQIYKGRQVAGIFYTNDPRLVIETTNLLSKSRIQYSILPLGAYLLACNPQRKDDCLAVSLQGEEFQIRPESVTIENDQPDTNPPTVVYREGSLHGCFSIRRRMICIRIF